MRFLFDQSADFRLIAHLRSPGHDVTAVSRNYPPGLADEDVLSIPVQEQRILLVADNDFGELVFNRGLAHAGVLFFRLPETKIERLDEALEGHAGDLAAGEFVVVTPGQIRVAARPRS